MTTRASLGDGVVESNGGSDQAAISGDGRYVAFTSVAKNLVASPAITGGFNVYRRDLLTFETRLVSVSTTGAMPLTTGAVPATSAYPAISDDGRYVVFHSNAVDLVAAPVAGASQIHVYRRDMAGGTVMVDVTPAGGLPTGGQGSRTPAVSADGRYIAFQSLATNLVTPNTTVDSVHTYWRDMDAPVATSVVLVDTAFSGGECSAPGAFDVNSIEAAISGDGLFVAYTSNGDDIVDPAQFVNPPVNATHVYRRGMPAGASMVVDLAATGELPDSGFGQGSSQQPSLSTDGRWVAFASEGIDLGSTGDQNNAFDVFVRDMSLAPSAAGAIERVSATNSGVVPLGYSADPRISGDGDRVIFTSGANNLVSGDTNAADDVFIRYRGARRTERVSLSTYGEQAFLLFPSVARSLSRDGRFLAFSTEAANLVSFDKNGVGDVFVKGPVAP